MLDYDSGENIALTLHAPPPREWNITLFSPIGLDLELVKGSLDALGPL